MSTSQIRFERRGAQRFDFNVPVALRVPSESRIGSGFTQNLTTRGVFLCTNLLLAAGDAVELTLAMPSEITLAETMRVRCQGRVLRVLCSGTEAKWFVAVHLEKYEYLPQDRDVPAFVGLLMEYPAGQDEFRVTSR